MRPLFTPKQTLLGAVGTHPFSANSGHEASRPCLLNGSALAAFQLGRSRNDSRDCAKQIQAGVGRYFGPRRRACRGSGRVPAISPRPHSASALTAGASFSPASLKR